MKYEPKEIIEIFVNQDWKNVESSIKAISKSKKILEKYYRAAIENKLESWKNSIRGKLALILIYDQAARFLFNDSRAYDTDNLARQITAKLYGKAEYKRLSPAEIMFAFFPYHHSENITHQKIANRIFKKLYEKEPDRFGWIYEASKEYNKIIERFGRFPHRNKSLGRTSTEEEKKFLKKDKSKKRA